MRERRGRITGARTREALEFFRAAFVAYLARRVVANGDVVGDTRDARRAGRSHLFGLYLRVGAVAAETRGVAPGDRTTELASATGARRLAHRTQPTFGDAAAPRAREVARGSRAAHEGALASRARALARRSSFTESRTGRPGRAGKIASGRSESAPVAHPAAARVGGSAVGLRGADVPVVAARRSERPDADADKERDGRYPDGVNETEGRFRCHEKG